MSASVHTHEPEAGPQPHSGLHRQYIGMFVAVVGAALLTGGASEIWFAHQERLAVAGLTTDEVDAALYRSIYRWGLLMLAGLALAALAGGRLARKVTVPLQALRAGVARIGTGDLDQRIDSKAGGELDALANAFNGMAGRLREARSDLEREAGERMNDLTESLEQQSVTADVLKAISRSVFDLQAVLDTLAESAARLCAADQAVLTRLRGDKHYMDATFGLNDAFRTYLEQNPYAEGRGTVTGRAIAEGRPVQILDVLADPEYTMLAGQRLGGWRSALGVPLLRDGKPIGALALLRRDVRRFSEKQIALVETFAAQAVIAIENVRLFDEAQARAKELTEALQQQVATGDILRAIASSPTDIAPVLKAVAQSACQLCEAYDAVVLLRDGADLVFDAHHGPIPINLDRWPLNRSWTAGRAVLDRMPVHVEDLTKEAGEFPDGYEMARRMGHRTTLSVPLLRESEGIGALVVRRTEVLPFTPKQIALLQTFADQAVIAIENVRLFDEVQARTQQLSEALKYRTATSDVLQVISRSAFDLQSVLDVLIESACRLCEAEHAFLFHRSGDVYRIASNHGFAEEFVEWMKKQEISPGRGTLVGRVALEGRTVHLPDATADPDYTWHEALAIGKMRTMLGVPLLRDGKPIGALSLVRLVVQPFTDRQIELVKTFADQAVIAMENARLFDEVQTRTRELARSVEELQALSDVGRAVASTLDVQKVLATIVSRAVDLSGADAGAIYKYRKSSRTFRLAEACNMDEELVSALRSIRIDEDGTAMGEATQSLQPVMVADLARRKSYPVRDISLAAGFRAALIVPLAAPERILGTLVLQRREAGEFPASVVRLTQAFANQSVLALQNARLYQELAEKSEQLKLASQHKSQFLANMSHELRTPLNAILGYAELLTDGIYGDLPEKPRSVLERVQSNGHHLLGLINDVLDLSKIEAGELKLTIDDYTLPSLLQSVLAATDSLARTKGLALSASIPNDLPVGRGDARRLSQVLLNLVGNAIKFTDVGEVAIAASASDGRFLIAIRDTGPGISLTDQERIFEEFQQLDNSSTREKGGSGLGLAIAQRIVAMHGGQISVTSAPGAGSTFGIDIPICTVAQENAS